MKTGIVSRAPTLTSKCRARSIAAYNFSYSDKIIGGILHAPIGQSQQLVCAIALPCGAAIAKLLSSGPLRQSN